LLDDAGLGPEVPDLPLQLDDPAPELRLPVEELGLPGLELISWPPRGPGGSSRSGRAASGERPPGPAGASAPASPSGVLRSGGRPPPDVRTLRRSSAISASFAWIAWSRAFASRLRTYLMTAMEPRLTCSSSSSSCLRL